jgi:hypothetical protein
MEDLTIQIDQKISRTSMGRPHVVILGAGASVAAFPEGDRNGRGLPVMNDLVDELGLESALDDAGVEHKDKDFESLYSHLHSEDEQKDVIDLIDRRVADYFAKLRLPDKPTLYDHLVLSLRPKDIIATFNWDPFLYDACARNHQYADLPHCVYLHGNVRIGYCLDDQRKGHVSGCCSQCGEPFTPSQLLYPVDQKDYSSDEFIRSEWTDLRNALENAFVITVFGYSAPKTDKEAVELMKDAWGDVRDRELEETEIIDIKSEDELRGKWDQFIHTHHYQVTGSFYDSILSKHPRRSCEAMWTQLMEAKWVEEHEFPRNASFRELRSWFAPILEHE